MILFLLVSAPACTPPAGEGGAEQTADGGEKDKGPASRASGPHRVLDPEKRGPYVVGVTTLHLKDPSRKIPDTDKPRPMVLEIWYPAEDAAKKTPLDRYDLGKDSPPEAQKVLQEKGVTIPPLPQDAHRDVKPLGSEGPYPLILFSHGSGGIRMQSVFQCVHLASHGYIVASVDHHGNTMYDLLMGEDARDQTAMARALVDRPLDMKFIYGEMVRLNQDKGGRFEGLILPQQLGVTGHSFGGLTSILSAKFLEEKVKVIIPQAPFSSATPGVKAQHLAYLPVMVMASQADRTLDYEKEQKGFYERLLLPAYHQADRYLFTLKRGGHFSFSDICKLDLLNIADKLGIGNAKSIISDGCSKDNIPANEGHRHINYYATALFNVILRQSEGSRSFLKERPEFSKEVSFVMTPAP